MKIAVIQLTSVLDPKINLEKIRSFLKDAVTKGAHAAFLPEVFYSISDGTKPTPYLVEPNNEHFKEIQKLAKDFKIFLLGGSAATLIDGKIFNRAYNFDPIGNLINFYDKINLFACDYKDDPSKMSLNEALIYSSGDKLEHFKVNEFDVGMSICFDLRFPEHFRRLSAQGINLISISSAFTVPTGIAHWETLVRARAIENQSYVVACGQWGQHNERIQTYGHSLIVGPWGEIIANAGDGEKVIYADLDINEIKKIRQRMNVLKSI